MAEEAVRLRTGDDIVAAVPHLVGFHPTNSAVLIGLKRRGTTSRLGIVQRIDLPDPNDETDTVDLLVRNLVRDHADTALLVIIDDSARCSRRPLVAAFDTSVGEAGIDFTHALWAASTGQGCEWCCYTHPDCRGVLSDPGSSVLAAVNVGAGNVTYTNRQEMIDQLAPVDEAVLLRRAQALRNAPVVSPAVQYATVLAAVADAAAGRLPTSDDQFVALASALVHPLVRDAALGAALGSDSDVAAAARALWTTLVRGTPPSHRAAPAVLLAVSAWQHGDGALAGEALDNAMAAQPGYALAELLHTMLYAAVSPAVIAGIVRDAVDGSVAELNAISE